MTHMDHDTEKLHRLVNSVPGPDEHDRNWVRIEQAVFGRLDSRPGLLARGRMLLRALTRPPVLVGGGLAAAAVVAALIVAPRRWGGPEVPVAATLSRGGAVEVCTVDEGTCDSATGWDMLTHAEQVCEGRRVRTGGEAYAAYAFDTLTGFTMAESSVVDIVRLGRHHQCYRLRRGAVSVGLARSHELQTLVVTTANAVCEAIGTVFSVTFAVDTVPVTLLHVKRGTVRMSSSLRPEASRVLVAPAALALVGEEFEEPLLLLPPDTSAGPDGPVPPLPGELVVPPVTLPLVPVPEHRYQVPELEQPVPEVPPVDTVVEPEPPVPPHPAAAPDTAVEPPEPRVIDSAWVAGTVLNRPLFYRHHTAYTDTVGWEEAVRAITGLVRRRIRTPAQASKVLAGEGYVLYELREATAIGVALLSELGYPVLMRTQWSAEVNGRWPADHRSYIEDDRAFSDHLYEQVERASVYRPGRVNDELAVKLEFRNGGYTVLDARRNVLLSQEPIGGVPALRMRDGGKRTVGGMPLRLVEACYVVVPRERGAEVVVRQLEEKMDGAGLDLSYRAPRLREAR